MLQYEDFLVDKIQTEPDPGSSILIVEDDRSLKMLFEWLIRDVDPSLRFDWCSSVEQANLALKSGKYKLVISDFMIEGMGSGLDVWENFCKFQPQGIFALISSLDLGAFCRLEGNDNPVPQLLHKPINVDEVQALIRRSTTAKVKEAL